DQNQVFQPEALNDDRFRRRSRLPFKRLITHSGVHPDLRRAFKYGSPQSFDFGARKHGEMGLGAFASSRLYPGVYNVEDAVQHALLDADLLNPFERDAALLAFEDAVLRDQLIAFDAIAERKIANERRRDRARDDRRQQ